jgi:hypothetical protein
MKESWWGLGLGGQMFVQGVGREREAALSSKQEESESGCQTYFLDGRTWLQESALLQPSCTKEPQGARHTRLQGQGGSQPCVERRPFLPTE